ncbi:MAG: c-type cytochrome [Flavobacteriaceae bacterium]|nr:c-type cytochrome [Flavobacteriaceae bacterium]
MIISTQPLKATVFIAIFCFISLGLNAQNGERIFKNSCIACHTVGGGKRVGPDLIGITTKRNEAWLTKWIRSSQSLIQSGDSIAIAVFEANNKVPMPDQNLSDAEIKEVVDYIKVNSTTAAVPGAATLATSAPQVPIKSSDIASAEEILLGQHIFEGDTRLTNGGVACISCHNVASNRIIPGGLLAKDLTTVHTRMGGDAGLTGILNAPPFPAMAEAYKNRPLTENEIYAVVSFLNIVEKESATQSATATSPLLKYGFISFAVWIVIIFIVWRHRKKYAVNKRIYERQLKTS